VQRVERRLEVIHQGEVKLAEQVEDPSVALARGDLRSEQLLAPMLPPPPSRVLALQL